MGTAFADPSCPDANVRLVAEINASAKACSLAAEASECAFCALFTSVKVDSPFAYDLLVASSATEAVFSSDSAALYRARLAFTSLKALTTCCVASRWSFSSSRSASFRRDRAISA